MTFPILPSNSATGGYQTQRSLRFNSADSEYLNRTFSTPTNNRVWTYSCWIKLSKSGTAADQFRFLDAGLNNVDRSFLSMNATGGFGFVEAIGGAYQQANTVAVFRDLSAWYHVVFSIDTTQAVDTNRVKIYVNGVNQSTTTNVAQNLSPRMNSAVVHNISRDVGIPTAGFLNGYMTEINFIDGQALDPSYFGATNATTGQWEPKAYSGSYGTNGFYLNFSDNSGTTATTLGKDYSGNGNNWTPNNFSVTAGAGNDSMIDVPTNWYDGTNGRGNYCTLNPLQTYSGTLSNGNLEYIGPGSWVAAPSTIVIPSAGQFYAEATLKSNPVNNSLGGLYAGFGVIAPSAVSSWNWNSGNSFYVCDTGYYLNYSTAGISVGTFTAGTVIGLAIDRNTNQVTVYQDGVSKATVTLGIASGSDICFFNGSYNNQYGQMAINFGQRPFAYTPPTGFKALNTQNLPSPTIAKGNTQFNPVLYTGNGSTQTISGTGFQPDLVWIKSRSNAYPNYLMNVITGAGIALESNSTSAEVNYSTYIPNFTSDGFYIATSAAGFNQSAATYVAWNWKANGAGVTNTAGTITSTVSANTTAGFSVVTYTGNGADGASYGHGLGVAPSMIITKSRSNVRDWAVYHASGTTTKTFWLNLTNAEATVARYTSVSSSVVVLPNQVQTNELSQLFVAYCFAAISGYSAFGSYTGNGSADGPFVYTGFRPAYVLIKCSNSTGNWCLFDNKRSGYNVNNDLLLANAADAEYAGSSYTFLDILSNGFKLRSNNADRNASGGTYIYAAFAESPFKYANAR